MPNHRSYILPDHCTFILPNQRTSIVPDHGSAGNASDDWMETVNIQL